ncbi:pyrroloquinoline quinone biosynthesis protein PqqB [Methylacidimicrobium cyclopophantes]|nr:MBL fold metallo-hydrolase [Methylacidimicrobium cyclopophantes]
MRLLVLGSGAGGGVPQWNCRCPNCTQAREERDLPFSKNVFRHTQASIALREAGEPWLLVNASPDLCSQFARQAELAPPEGAMRASPLAAVALTDGQIDHATGLLFLREGTELTLVCTDPVWKSLGSSFPIVSVLRHFLPVNRLSYPAQVGSLLLEALPLRAGPAPYEAPSGESGHVVALRVTGKKSGGCVVYAPGLPEISSELADFVAGSDCLLVDGTFWSEEELAPMSRERRRSILGSHLPISGPGGTLEWLAKLPIPQKLYVHINNTNPILDPGSPPAKEVKEAGVGIAYDGMLLSLYSPHS